MALWGWESQNACFQPSSELHCWRNPSPHWLCNTGLQTWPWSHTFRVKAHLNVLENTSEIWAENIFFAKRLQEEPSKFLPWLILQDIYSLPTAGSLHQAAWRAAPTMAQTSSLLLTARYADCFSKRREMIHVNIFCQMSFFSCCFGDRTAFEGAIRKESIVLSTFRSTATFSPSSFSFWQELTAPLMVSFGPHHEWFQFGCFQWDFGEGSSSSEVLPVAGLLHSTGRRPSPWYMSDKGWVAGLGEGGKQRSKTNNKVGKKGSWKRKHRDRGSLTTASVQIPGGYPPFYYQAVCKKFNTNVNLTFSHCQTAGLQSSATPHSSCSKRDQKAKMYAALVRINNNVA